MSHRTYSRPSGSTCRLRPVAGPKENPVASVWNDIQNAKPMPSENATPEEIEKWLNDPMPAYCEPVKLRHPSTRFDTPSGLTLEVLPPRPHSLVPLAITTVLLWSAIGAAAWLIYTHLTAA